MILRLECSVIFDSTLGRVKRSRISGKVGAQQSNLESLGGAQTWFIIIRDALPRPRSRRGCYHGTGHSTLTQVTEEVVSL